MKFCVPLITTDGAEGATDTVIALTVIVARADSAGYAWDVAVSVTVKSCKGGVAGAVYVTGFEVELLSVPHGAVLHVTDQVTDCFDVPPIVAVNCCLLAAVRVTVEGLTDTAIAGTVIVTEADFVLSVAEAAVRVTARLLEGGVAGAVYVVALPLAVDDGETLPQEAPPHETVQVTPP